MAENNEGRGRGPGAGGSELSAGGSDPAAGGSEPGAGVHGPESLHGSAAGHETADVNVWAIGRFAVALMVIIGISLGLLVGLFKYFQTREQAQPTAVGVDPDKLFPQPRLERTPYPDLQTIRAEEDRLLSSYGWVDAPRGVVRIPIDVAIDLLAKKGLPSRPRTELPTAAAEVSQPTESGLGIASQEPARGGADKP